ncbi:hypothetical protein C2G38_2154690 [Gigaspora rosea]|uniref:Uncharacterized protein n=1 Tax=Gigaspora rosea TaxID=44941 RepID=A0A397W8K1_9GLOM|nr:hypothetical protein C2G38_2154690 [Gigaspora rosea]
MTKTDTVKRLIKGTSHATLHVVFQFTLPIPLKSLKDVNTNEQINSSIFYNDNIECTFFEQYSNNWDIDNIYEEIVKNIPLGCQVLATNFLLENKHLDIVSDEQFFVG